MRVGINGFGRIGRLVLRALWGRPGNRSAEAGGYEMVHINDRAGDAVFEMDRTVTVEQVNGAFQEAANGPLHGILGYENRPLVSVDYVNDSRSAIIDALSTMVTGGTQLKVYAWYDNEWGYSCRMADLVCHVAGLEQK